MTDKLSYNVLVVGRIQISPMGEWHAPLSYVKKVTRRINIVASSAIAAVLDDETEEKANNVHVQSLLLLE